jgi:hypothetical protein
LSFSPDFIGDVEFIKNHQVIFNEHLQLKENMKNRITIIIIVSISFFNSKNVFCQLDTIKTKDSACFIFLTNIAYLAPAFLTWNMIHELGHYSIASAFGADNVRMGLYKKSEGQVSIGWYNYKKGSMNKFGTALTNIGGVLFSRGLAECSDLFLKNVSMPNWGQRYFSMMFIISRFDMPRYILQDALLNFFDKEGSDIDNFVTVISGKNTGSRTLIYALLLTVTTFDLVMDWDRITIHWNILDGRQYHPVKSSNITRLRISPYYSKNTIGINLHKMF